MYKIIYKTNDMPGDNKKNNLNNFTCMAIYMQLTSQVLKNPKHYNIMCATAAVCYIPTSGLFIYSVTTLTNESKTLNPKTC